MPKLLVVADDLSGATDVGVQFARFGIQGFVAAWMTTRLVPDGCGAEEVEQPDLAKLFQEYEVVIVNAESRHLPGFIAGERVALLVRAARAAGVQRFYKKTDSTLRGNLGAELEALWRESGSASLAFIPSHPLLGRTTRRGIQYVHGSPLDQSEFARDPRSPMSESHVAKILGWQTQAPVTIIEQNTLSSGPLAEGINVFDAESEEELMKAVTAIARAGGMTALAGPAAFAARLPLLEPFIADLAETPPLVGPLLVVNGSLNDVSFRQAALGLEDGFLEVRMTPKVLVPLRGPDTRAGDQLVDRATARLARGRPVLLHSVSSVAEVEEFADEAAAIDPTCPDLHDRVAQHTGRLVARILMDLLPDCRPLMVVFGGDTLIGIAAALGWSGFIPRDELMPGVALVEVHNAPNQWVISKPGGFGSDAVLPQLAKRIGGK